MKVNCLQSLSPTPDLISALASLVLPVSPGSLPRESPGGGPQSQKNLASIQALIDGKFLQSGKFLRGNVKI